MRFAVGLLLALAIASPAAAGLKIEVPPPVTVPPVEAGAQVQAVSLSKIGTSLPDGQVVAEVGGSMFLCTLNGQPIAWRSGANRFADHDFERIFREEFAKAGLKVSGDETNLFEEDSKTSDLQIGALLTDLKAKICLNLDNVTVSGSGTIKVEWQVYSTSAGKVLARIPTAAGASGVRASNYNAGFSRVIQQSFAESVRALAANPDFRAIVLGPKPASAPLAALAAGPLKVGYATSNKPTAIKDAATGAVMVFAGAGSGSGALISADGYILTDHHVAGDSGRVRIRWSDGSESVGDVVRADRRRDVALIKVATPKGQPLTIRPGPVELGETVFAIGTPLEDAFRNSVTRGIVSALRMFDGESFIQSDTPVTHGNSGGPLLDANGALVGLTDLGLDPSKGSTINLFIPINDALKVLALTPAA